MKPYFTLLSHQGDPEKLISLSQHFSLIQPAVCLKSTHAAAVMHCGVKLNCCERGAVGGGGGAQASFLTLIQWGNHSLDEPADIAAAAIVYCLQQLPAVGRAQHVPPLSPQSSSWLVLSYHDQQDWSVWTHVWNLGDAAALQGYNIRGILRWQSVDPLWLKIIITLSLLKINKKHIFSEEGWLFRLLPG